MNSLQIETILRTCRSTREHFLGCFALDEIPPKHRLPRLPVSLIVNLDPARDEGSHWVALYVPNASAALYWDSYALPTPEPIRAFLREFPNVQQNKKTYQSLDSNVCGHYCIFFLYSLSNGCTFPKLTRILNQNLPHTDMYVKKFVNKLIK